MGEAFDALFQLDEGSVIGKLGNLALDYVVDMVLFLEGEPGILAEMLEGKIDALFLGFESNDLEFYVLALADVVLGTGHMAPAHIVDVEQSVEAAAIDECTETREA